MSKHKTPYSYTHSFLSTTKHLGKIRRLLYKQFLHFLFYVNSLKKFFVSKRKFNCFKKMSIFSDSLLPKTSKLRILSLRLVFLIRIVYHQFLLLKNLFPLIWNALYLISPQSHKFPIGVESLEILSSLK